MTELAVKDINVEDLIRDTFEEALYENDASFCSFDKYDDEYLVEMEFYSPAGEDVIVSFYFDGSLGDFVNQFKQYAIDFDVDEHVELWADGRGKNGVPDTIRELLDDAESIQEILNSISDDLYEAYASLEADKSLDDLVSAAENKKAELEVDHGDYERESKENDDLEK